MKRKNLGLLICLFISLIFILYNNLKFLPSDNNSFIEDILISTSQIEIDGNEELEAYCYDGVNNGSSWDLAYIIENDDNGYEIRNTDKNLIIRNCTFELERLTLTKCDNIKIVNCSFKLCFLGIHLDGIRQVNESIAISNCEFTECSEGIFSEFTQEIKINNCIFNNTSFVGLRQFQTNYTTIYNNSFYNTGWSSIRCSDCDNNNISNNRFINGNKSAIFIGGDSKGRWGKDNVVSNNFIENCKGPGIYIDGKENMIASNKIIHCESDGIQLGITFHDWGLYAVPSYNKIIFNNISLNKGNGIYLEGKLVSVGSMVTDRNYWLATAYNEIYNNTIMDNEENGILLEFPCHDNMIYNNKILFNKQYCIVDRSSTFVWFLGSPNDYFQNGNCSVFYEVPSSKDKQIFSFNITIILGLLLFVSFLFYRKNIIFNKKSR
ncbi:MAG: right-handed parallel beta-helix repeat-containing protein [Promethearchaeota archaeon]